MISFPQSNNVAHWRVLMVLNNNGVMQHRPFIYTRLWPHTELMLAYQEINELSKRNENKSHIRLSFSMWLQTSQFPSSWIRKGTCGDKNKSDILIWLTEKKKQTLTFGVVVCEQLDVKLLSECCQVRRHHTAGGQVDLVTAGLHLVQERGYGHWLALSAVHWLITEKCRNIFACSVCLFFNL